MDQKNFNKKLILNAINQNDRLFSFLTFFVIIFSMFLFACQKEVSMPESLKPTIANQLFSIDENPNSNAFVGIASAMNNDSIYKSAYINKFKSLTKAYNDLLVSNKLRFEILGGNDGNAFKIDPINGTIKVNDSSAINYEARNDFRLQVRIYDITNQNLCDTSDIEISINDVKAPVNGLVSHFPFSQTLTDVIGGKNGKGKNIGYFTDRYYNINEVVDFVGFQSYVTLDSSYDFADRTISLWFSIVDTGKHQQIIYSSDYDLLNNQGVIVSVVNSSNTIELQIQAGDATQKVPTTLDEWHLVSIVSQTGQALFYFDGKLVSAKTVSSKQVLVGGNQHATLGVGPSLNSNFFSGRIDDLYIYNRVLTDKEINILFTE